MCKIPSYSPVILSPALRPYAHLEALDPNLGESGSSSMAGDIFGIFSNGNDFCFEEAAFRDRSANPTFHEAYDWDKENCEPLLLASCQHIHHSIFLQRELTRNQIG